MSKPIFAIIGGTGHQGGSVLHTVAENFKGKFHFRILTKNATSPKAIELKKQYGADIEFVQGDVAEADKLFNGATWAYIVTNFWDPNVHMKEAEIGKAFADSAKKQGVKHVIFSTLPPAKIISGGKYHVPHFDLKYEVEQHIRQIGLDAAFISLGCYYQNWIQYFAPRPNGDGTYSISMPNAPGSFIAAFDVNETGKMVAHFVNHWAEVKGKIFPLAGDNIHPQQFVETIAEVTGLKIKYVQVPYDVFQGFAGAETAIMLHYFEDFGFFGDLDWQEGKRLVGFSSFKDWAKKNAEALKPKPQAQAEAH